MWQPRGLNECPDHCAEVQQPLLGLPVMARSSWLALTSQSQRASDAKSDANRAIEDNHAGDSWCGAPQPSRRRASPAVAAVAP